MKKQSYYEILCVDSAATLEEIKKAYRKIALRHHPDRHPDNPDSVEFFREASEAYQVLSDPNRRNVYDKFGDEGLMRSGWVGFEDVEEIFDQFADLFSDFFGVSAPWPKRHRGRGHDEHKKVVLTLREAVFGAKKEIDISHDEECPECRGIGINGGPDAKPCLACRGTGQLVNQHGAFVFTSSCPVCRGTGSGSKNPCKHCHGAGKIRIVRKVTVVFPPGISDGQAVRVVGQGSPGAGGGLAGNLYVTVTILPDELFKREGDDLVVTVPVSYSQLALGNTILVPSLEREGVGKVEASIRPGTQVAEEIVLPQLGAVKLNGGSRGNLRVKLEIKVPSKLSKKHRSLLEELSKIE